MIRLIVNFCAMADWMSCLFSAMNYITLDQNSSVYPSFSHTFSDSCMTNDCRRSIWRILENKHSLCVCVWFYVSYYQYCGQRWETWPNVRLIKANSRLYRPKCIWILIAEYQCQYTNKKATYLALMFFLTLPPPPSIFHSLFLYRTRLLTFTHLLIFPFASHWHIFFL